MIRTELLSGENFHEYSLDHYQRRHDVKRVYRRQNDVYEIVECTYTEDWDIAQKRQIAKFISSMDEITYLALEESAVVGFIALRKTLLDSYMILDMLHVSAPVRRQGTGRKLFEIGKKVARNSGGRALYISACSSEETIAFYRAMGAEPANLPIREIADKEPYDLQMICPVI